MQEIQHELAAELERTGEMVHGFLQWMVFCNGDTARDEEFQHGHLLSFLSQDVLETLAGALLHVKNGIHTPAMRESRYLLELAIKMAYVQQASYQASIEEKLRQFYEILSSHKISLMRKVRLSFLSQETAELFIADHKKSWACQLFCLQKGLVQG